MKVLVAAVGFLIALQECLCGEIVFPTEKHLKNVRQLTWGGENTSPALSPNGKWFVYQGAGLDEYGLCCDQIYKMRTDLPGDKQTARRMTSGIGMTMSPKICPDGDSMICSSTVVTTQQKSTFHSCPRRLCLTDAEKNETKIDHICRRGLTWDLFPEFDIFMVNKYGNAVTKLTTTEGYDGEPDVSPDGQKVVFTSMRTGDPEIWIMNIDGSHAKQLTNAIGYDGSPAFSYDGKQIVYRASRPKTLEEIHEYKRLLGDSRVSPLAMELFIMNADGSGQRQLTNLGGTSYTPFFMKDGKRVIFSSNFEASNTCHNFHIYIIDTDGKNLEKVTANEDHYDAFPKFDRDQKTIIWSSDRNSTIAGEANIFIADWIDDIPDSEKQMVNVNN